MNKQQQIEEIAQIINGSTELDTIAYYRCMNIAKTIYNAGYQKIPEDSVVLSKEEYIDLSRNYVGEQVEQTRKETAEKIFKMLISKLDSNQFLSGKRIIMEVDVENLAKQFDVEIEEL